MDNSFRDMPVTAATAQAVARAVLGPGAHIVMASFSGLRPGMNGGAAVWQSGRGTGPAWLDIDFVPEGPVLSVALVLLSADVRVVAAALERGLIGLWVNGREFGAEALPCTAANPPPARQEVAVAAPVEVTLQLRLALVPGELASLRIGLDDLGGVGTVIMVARAGAAALPVAEGAGGAVRSADRAVATAGAGLGAALLPGAAEANTGKGKGKGNNNGNGNGNDSTSTSTTASNNGQQGAIANPDSYTMARGGSITVDLRANDTAASMSSLHVIGINGVAISVGQTLTLLSGQTIRLNADKTVTITAGSATGTFVFDYTVAAGQGNGASSSAQVTLTVVPCFVAGTRILTPCGEVAVEALRPGDMVLTLDDGPQPLRWVGARRLAAVGPVAPVHLRAGVLGAHRTLMVSPQHRVLIRNPACALLFGEEEVLVAAKDLLGAPGITQRGGGEVTYVHLMFDRHQVVISEGLPTESFLPGSQAQTLFAPAQLAQIAALFPWIDLATGAGYGPAARRVLRRHEARVLRAGVWRGSHREEHPQGLFRKCA